MANTNKYQNTPEFLELIEKYPDTNALNEAKLSTKEIVEIYYLVNHEDHLVNEAMGNNPNDFDEIESNMHLNQINDLQNYTNWYLALQFVKMWDDTEI